MMITLPETNIDNIALENGWLEYLNFPFGKVNSQGLCSFQGGYSPPFTLNRAGY